MLFYKKIYILLLSVFLVAGLGALFYWFILPNYKDTIGDSSGSGQGVSQSLRIAKDMKVYSEEAEAIVVGRFVGKGNSVWNSDKSQIYTNLNFKISEVLKGSDMQPGEELVIKQHGGKIDDEAMVTEDEIKYVEGQQDVLFLGTNEDNDYVVFAGDWGQYIITGDNTAIDSDGKTFKLDELKEEIEGYLK